MYLCRMKDKAQNTDKELKASYLLAYIILPPSILDWFELVDVQEKEDVYKRKPEETVWSEMTTHVYLDEKDNRSDDDMGSLRPNGFTEPTAGAGP